MTEHLNYYLQAGMSKVLFVFEPTIVQFITFIMIIIELFFGNNNLSGHYDYIIYIIL
jgi:hypothetical protein